MKEMASADFLPLKIRVSEIITCRIQSLPGRAIECDRLVLAVRPSRCQKDTASKATLYNCIATNAVTKDNMSESETIIGLTYGLGGICTVKKISFHGYAHIRLDLVILTRSVSFETRKAVAETIIVRVNAAKSV